MKQIILNQNKVLQIDDEDFEWVNQWKWTADKLHGNWYVRRKTWEKGTGKRETVKLHRALLDVTDPKIFVDHIDGNPLNNQRSNLRLATPKQNAQNRKPKVGSTSSYLGVSLYTNKTRPKIAYRWKAQISANKVKIPLGYFPFTSEGEIQAAKAYDEAAKKHFGEFANLNFKD